MMETIKNLAYVEGFLTALASVMQDREMTSETPGRITSGMHFAVSKLKSVEGFIKGQDSMIDSRNEDAKTYEAEIARLKELNQIKLDEIDKLNARIKELREASEPVCASAPDVPKVKPVPLTIVNPCDAWRFQDGRGKCWGVPEKPECTCGGDKDKCDFYGG